MLEGPNDLLIEWSLNIELRASNNMTEYEALIINMPLNLKVSASTLKDKNESKTV